ncbi:YdbH domain-containing protein [uncultured Sphingomonas sp.]|uniref:intermembrane phospholipid transport protein YdbH family protein n=1 Tax=uncultured Sphingomonas sp. TaxID=158754 RepID=UPI0025DBC6BA|nr:YdbH domain-containing protein [uncultured Sphingomonas sp.]
MDQLTGEQAPHQEVVVRRRWPRALGWGLLGFLGLLIVALGVLWTQRRPLANDILAREMERRGVQASYRLDRVGLRTQQLSNLVIGDPANPDLTARVAQVQMRIHLTGRVEIFRVVARGVRLNGRVVGNRVSWGQLDRLLPPPSGKPFTLPDVTVDVADTSIALATPYGPLGVAVEGAGNLTGGFRGRLAAASPQLDAGRCTLADMRANVRVSVSARRPRVSGPLSASSFRCPSSNIAIAQPRFEIDSRFSEAFERFTGRGRMSATALTAGVNGLAGLNAGLTFAGEPTRILGTVKLAARGARLSEIQAERTRLDGSYLLNAAQGNITLVADYAAQNADLAPSLTAGLTDALRGTNDTPLEPLAAALRRGLEGATRDMNAAGSLRLVNFPGGGAVRIETANVRTASGARIQVGGGDGITYYWPGNRLRIDGDIATQGGGLPTTRIALNQPRSGAPISGTVRVAPYAADGARLALAPINFAAARDGSTNIQTVALLDGPVSGGEVRGLRVPINGRVGRGGALEFGRGCSDVRFASLRLGGLRLGSTSLPVCATGHAIVYRAPGGAVRVGAGTSNLVLNGRLGASPFALRSERATFTGPEDFRLAGVNVRMGRPESPILLNANAATGTFGGSGIRGRFDGADGVIGRVPIALSEMSGNWLLYKSRLTVDGALTASDRLEAPRFYPLRTEDARFTLGDDRIRATGTLRHPATGTRVTEVAIDHRLSTGTGGATLDVPGIAFGPRLQPEQLTRLTEGQIALIDGTIYGQGRIAWYGEGVTSTGEFSTDDLDLAAAFGPVTGLKGTMRFTDLLALETAPGQTMQVASINPGILVENGIITYQLLPGQQVRVESGRWPFMGGQLVLQETLLSLGRPSAKRLTFEVVGLDANRFVQSFGFKEIGATGVFDGVLPMTFDESGGRIVGGKLDSRAPGGSLSYNGVVNRANLGLMGNIAFNALRDLRFRSMIIRLDGDLAGEFATRLTIDGVALGGTTRTQRLIRSVTSKLPIRLNVTIRGPFRALIATAKSMRDPRAIISTTLDRPLEEIPGITTEVRRREEATSQTQTPVDEQVTPEPSTRSRP